MLPIAPRPTRRTRSKHGGKKLTIEERLLAAMERMLEQGQRYVSLSVEELAAEAGMSRGTFYSHFRDKNELIARLMSLITDEIVDSAGSWLGTAPDGERPLRKDMEATMVGVSKTFRKHRAILSAFADSARQDDALGQQFQKMMDTICGRCRAAIAAVSRSGAARPGTGDDEADALSWFVVTYLGRFSPLREGEDLARLTKAVALICASAIFADEQS
ncbi:TetR/AcrR family transcriptional regulator [Nevskia sp.]|uniref:TetR/AcrR family transcriptional regulator n=1 Tax=Nevskia sp. TaxID=1929292 RepID=UPI0025D72FB3|nr:TetR/AcrR family transcriptional regulator [Nevskia sp.]